MFETKRTEIAKTRDRPLVLEGAEMKALQKGWMLLAHAMALTIALLGIVAWNSQKSSRPALEGSPDSTSIHWSFAWKIS
jgi:hypothetical protein